MNYMIKQNIVELNPSEPESTLMGVIERIANTRDGKFLFREIRKKCGNEFTSFIFRYLILSLVFNIKVDPGLLFA